MSRRYVLGVGSTTNILFLFVVVVFLSFFKSEGASVVTSFSPIMSMVVFCYHGAQGQITPE